MFESTSHAKEVNRVDYLALLEFPPLRSNSPLMSLCILSFIVLEKLKNIDHHMSFPPLRTMPHLLCIWYAIYF